MLFQLSEASGEAFDALPVRPADDLETVRPVSPRTSKAAQDIPHLAGEEHASLDGVYWEAVASKNSKTTWVCYKRCTLCKTAIKLGHGETLHAYNVHYNSAACHSAAAKQEKRCSQCTLFDMFQHPSKSESKQHEDASTTLTFPVSVGSKLGPGATADECEITAMFTDRTVCPGCHLDWPSPIARTYPFQLHAFDVIPFTFEYWDHVNDSIYVRSWSCHCIPKTSGRPCAECASLNDSAIVMSMRLHVDKPVPTSLNFQYYNFDQLAEGLDRRNNEKNDMKLEVCIHLAPFRPILMSLVLLRI